MLKTFGYAILGGIILLFAFAMFFPALQDASGNSTIAMGNTTNLTGLSDAVTLTPLLLWLGLFSVPLILITIYLWHRRRAAGYGS